MPTPSDRREPDDAANKVLAAAAEASREIAQGDLFYRSLAQHLARQATNDFQRNRVRSQSAADAVAAFVKHEQLNGRLGPDDVVVSGEGFHVQADIHQCAYVSTCQNNYRVLGDVPQCIRAITLIEAVSAKIPERPPMSYDLDPGLVDETSGRCRVDLRPAGVPSPPAQERARR